MQATYATSPILRDYAWTGKHQPFEHQKTTSAFLVNNAKAFCFSEAGCVDSNTEYLSPTGWRRMDEYGGGDVAQYHPDTGSYSFVTPTEYVKLPCERMVRIKTKYGVDQLLSPEHRVLLVDGKNANPKREVVSASALLDRHNLRRGGFLSQVGGHRLGTTTIAFSSAAVPSAFTGPGGSGLPMTDDELRLQVAVIADGYFSPRGATKRCTIRVKKQRKVARLRSLLHAANTAFAESTPEYVGAEGFHIFVFDAPRRDKVFDAPYWEASLHQLQVIADEVLHWDGSTVRGESFSTSSKATADFIQYVLCSVGRTTRLVVFDRSTPDKPRLEYALTLRNEQQNRLYIYSRHNATMWEEESTDGFKYCFMVPSTFLVFRRNGCVFASGNTGKTASVIWSADYLMKRKLIKRVLVVCPLSIMRAAWQADLFKFAMHRSCVVAHGDTKARLKAIAAGTEFVIINYDGLAVVKDALKAAKFDLIVADEATMLKTVTTTRWKVFREIAETAKGLWMLTGTPAAQSPLDAYGLAKLVNPDTPRYFGAFRDQVMYKVTQFKYVPKPTADATVHKLLQPAIRYEKKDCLDLPPVMHLYRDAPMTPSQKKAYSVLRAQLRMEAGDETITAVNAAAKMTKLLQVACGSVYADSGQVLDIDVSTRLNVVLEALAETPHKSLIFVPFTHSIDLLKDLLAKNNISCDVIDGRVPPNRRAEIVQAFQTKADPHVLILQPQAAAHGLTLTAADTVIWYAPVTSVETYLQANARIDRPGQKNNMTVVHIQGSEVEAKLYSMLANKLSGHDRIVDLYRQEMLEP